MDSEIESAAEAMTDLSGAECRRRIRTATTGRVARAAPDGPRYCRSLLSSGNGNVVFRTSPTGLLSALRHRTNVAFEIDSIGSAAAWSVVVRGVAERVRESYDLIELWEDEGLVPLAPGKRPLFIEIQPRTITGRQYLAAGD